MPRSKNNKSEGLSPLTTLPTQSNNIQFKPMSKEIDFEGEAPRSKVRSKTRKARPKARKTNDQSIINHFVPSQGGVLIAADMNRHFGEDFNVPKLHTVTTKSTNAVKPLVAAKISPEMLELQAKEAILTTLAQEILGHSWNISIGGQLIQSGNTQCRLPKEAAEVYKVCIAETLNSDKAQNIKEKFNKITAILEKTQHDSPLMWLIRKLDFLHLFTHSQQTQTFYNNKYSLFAAKKEAVAIEEPIVNAQP